MNKTDKLIEEFKKKWIRPLKNYDVWRDPNIMEHLLLGDLQSLLNSAVEEQKGKDMEWHKREMLRDLKFLKNCAIGNLFPLYTKEERGECVAMQIDEMKEKLLEQQEL